MIYRDVQNTYYGARYCMAAPRNDFLTTADRTVFMLRLDEYGVLDHGTATLESFSRVEIFRTIHQDDITIGLLSRHIGTLIFYYWKIHLHPTQSCQFSRVVEGKGDGALKALRNVR
jgi:hypothetical protein